MDQNKPKRGRPRKPTEFGSKSSHSVWLTGALRQDIMKVSDARGVSMSEEMSDRIERSLGLDRVMSDLFGGAEAGTFILTLSRCIREVQDATSKRFGVDKVTTDAALIAAARVIGFYAKLSGVPADEDHGQSVLIASQATTAAVKATNRTLSMEFFEEAAVSVPDPRNTFVGNSEFTSGELINVDLATGEAPEPRVRRSHKKAAAAP